jgi:hypothetical protein
MMRPNVHTLYVEFLHSAAERVKAGDKLAAMFCLQQALRAANSAHDSRYRRAVFRAMSFARRLP